VFRFALALLEQTSENGEVYDAALLCVGSRGSIKDDCDLFQGWCTERRGGRGDASVNRNEEEEKERW